MAELNDGNWPRAIVSGFPGPALAADVHGRVILRNRAAVGVLTVVDEDGERLRSDLGRRGATLALKGAVDHWAMTLGGEDGGAARSFTVTAIPIPSRQDGEPVVAFLASETTLETSLRNALIESRSFFRDLVVGGGDFVWAVDAEGIFTYASEPGFAGLSAQQLHGTHWEDLFPLDADRAAAAAIFESTEPVAGADLWFGADGGRRCCRMALKPLFGPGGDFRGVRGVARDVTDMRRREIEAERQRAAEHKLNGVLRDIGGETDPEAMLATAASSVVSAVGLGGCWIFQRAPGDDFAVDSATTLHVVQRRHARSSERHSNSILRQLAAKAAKASTHDPVTEAHDGWEFVAAPARHGGAVMGVLCFGRFRGPGTTAGWDEDERLLITRVAEQVAIAIRMSEQHQQLLVLSRIDSLTGLLNRRAFLEEADRRRAIQIERGGRAAVLFIDLDRFKAVNDQFGHKVGDRFLTAVAEMIVSSIRPGDFASRYGGDEFGVWLDAADEAGALRKAEDLIARSRHMRMEELPGEAAEGAFAMSIGIAVLDSRWPEAIDEMIHRADTALYAVKTDGGGGVRCAPPPDAAVAEHRGQDGSVAELERRRAGS